MRGIGRLCNRAVDEIRGSATVASAARRMLQRNVGTLIVRDDEDDQPTGIVTDRDIAMKVVAAGLDPGQVTVREVMSVLQGRLEEDASIEEALQVMRSGAFRRLPVVSAGDELVGIVSLDDILVQLARETDLIRQLLEQEGPDSLQERVRLEEARS